MDPLEAVFVFCFVFGLAMSGLSFLLGSLHLPGLGHHDGGHELGGGHGAAEPHPGHGGHADAHLGHGGHPAGHGGSGGPATAGHAGEAGHGTGEGPESAARGGPSPINLTTATAFLAFFGGVGYILYGALGVPAALALVVGAGAGLAAGAVVFFFLVKILFAGQRFLDPADFRLEGSLARVTRAIRADGIGEIVYVKDGTRRSEGARSANGEPIAAGTEVVIVRYERGLAFVEPWATYAEQHA